MQKTIIQDQSFLLSCSSFLNPHETNHRLSSYPFNTACFFWGVFSGTILQDILIYSWLTSEQPHGRYRLQTVKSLAGVSLMLRLLWASLRWDDMAVKPSAAVGTTRTGTTDLQATALEKPCFLEFVFDF